MAIGNYRKQRRDVWRQKASFLFDVDGETTLLPNIMVVESEPIFSGLYDSSGNELVKLKEPMGFKGK